jgi:tyrosyl-tRNA synthetase
MTTQEKIDLISRDLDEVLTEGELRSLIESGTPLKHYIGFEISGKLHIGYLFILMKVKDFQDAGAETTIWMADLHSAINNKLDGNLDTIKRVAHEYFKEAVKALFISIGGDPEKLIFKLTSETYAQNPDFWQTFLEIGKSTTLARTMRSITIMGREQSDESIDTAKLMYPIMQSADIFLLGANIAHAGIDQRKVHVIARDNAMVVKTHPLKNSRGEQIKPIAVHHPIMLGLSAPDTSEETQNEDNKDIAAMRNKMSKSKADSSVSVHDLTEDIIKKINQAYAPEGQGSYRDNPVLNWTKYLVFHNPDSVLTIKRAEKFGGDVAYHSYEELEKDYQDKKLHPMDLKSALAEWLVGVLEPVRKYFEDPGKRAALIEVEALSKSI